MAALAVDQHQRLVGAEAAQGRRAKHIGAVGDRRLREVERRHQLVEDLAGFGLAAVADGFRADDVDRDRAVGDGSVGAAGAGDDDRRFVRGRFLDLRVRRFLRHLLILLGEGRRGERQR